MRPVTKHPNRYTPPTYPLPISGMFVPESRLPQASGPQIPYQDPGVFTPDPVTGRRWWRLADRPGYGRPLPGGAVAAEAFWISAGVVGFLAFMASPAHMILAPVALVFSFLMFCWIEWFERCEDRALANQVFWILMAVLVVIGVLIRRDTRNYQMRNPR